MLILPSGEPFLRFVAIGGLLVREWIGAGDRGWKVLTLHMKPCFVHARSFDVGVHSGKVYVALVPKTMGLHRSFFS